MANYYASSRTNYVKCSDKEGLIKSIKPFGLNAEFRKINNKDIVVFKSNDDNGCWPSWIDITLDEYLKRKTLTEWFMSVKPLAWFSSKGNKEKINNTKVEKEFNWEEVVMPFIAIDEVLIVISVGAEKLRYITGISEAYIRLDNDNDYDSIRSVFIDLNFIYTNASFEFRVDINKISRAEY